MPTIANCSVKVMRSHDYCHFEVCLSAQVDLSGILFPQEEITCEMADELRKKAARLADKAVEQYKSHKRHVEQSESFGRGFDTSRSDAAEIEAKPETERTPEEQAILKHYKDAQFAASRNYDYQDDWEDFKN